MTDASCRAMPARRARDPVKDYLAALGRKGGAARAKALSARQRKRIASAGGKASAAKLTAAQRSENARRAVLARWAKRKTSK
jgi:hypothetical protein